MLRDICSLLRWDFSKKVLRLKLKVLGCCMFIASYAESPTCLAILVSSASGGCKSGEGPAERILGGLRLRLKL